MQQPQQHSLRVHLRITPLMIEMIMKMMLAAWKAPAMKYRKDKVERKP